MDQSSNKEGSKSMANYKRLSPGNWRFRFKYVDKLTQKEHEVKRSGFRTRPEAVEECEKMQQEIRDGYSISDSIGLVKFITYWLENIKKSEVAKNTYKTHLNSLNKHIQPYFQDMKMVDLTFPIHQKFINFLIDSGQSKRSVEIIHGTMYGAMKFAKKIHKVKENPYEDVQIYTARERAELRKKKKKQLKYIPYDGIKPFLEAALEDNYNYYIFFKFLIETGMRKGEAMALQWNDVDLKNRIIKVEQTIDYDPEDTDNPFGDTKTFSSERTFKITKDFALELRAHKVRQNDNVMRFKKKYKSELNLVLCREDGSPFPKSTLFNAFRRILKKVELPNLPIHSLRHTHTVLMLEAGAIMKDMQERLGHSSMQITEDIYADTSEIIQEDSINKFEKHTKNILNLGATSGQKE